MKAYSEDLRERVLKAVDQGIPRKEVVRLFGVSLASIKRYLKQRSETGSIAPKPIPGCPPTKRVPLQAKLQAQLEVQPDATLQEHCDTWEATSGMRVSISTMSRAIKEIKWTRKKKHWQLVREKKKSEKNGEKR